MLRVVFGRRSSVLEPIGLRVALSRRPLILDGVSSRRSWQPTNLHKMDNTDYYLDDITDCIFI